MAEPQRKRKAESREVQRTEPGQALAPWEEMERMFDELMPHRWMRPFRGGWRHWGELTPFEGRMPRVDVQDRESDLLVRAELPGVKKDDLDISVSEGAVTIKASTRQETEEGEAEGDYYRREIASGTFARTIPLPADVDADQAKAKFADGVLSLTLPKREAAQRKRISVE